LRRAINAGEGINDELLPSPAMKEVSRAGKLTLRSHYRHPCGERKFGKVTRRKKTGK